MEPSDLISGRYRIGEPIGRGGMATIYRATDEHMMDRPVAVKVLREVYSSDPKFVTRFQREARAASALQHPNIVQVFDYGQSADAYYIVMEFIDGMDLRRYLKRRGVLPIERGVQIARDVALGLGAAHRRGIVHRDVKPQNIMLNEEGVVKLTDFGIASMYKDVDEQRLTTTGMTLGTVQYYAPEQAQGEMVRPSADVYAMGIVMYEMLTGQTPFDGDTPVAVAMKHIQEIPESPSALNPRIPPALERIIMHCLEKDPQARFRDGDTLAAALDSFLRSPSRRPSGPGEAVGAYGQYGPSNPGMPRAGVPSGPRPNSYSGGQAPTGGPRSGARGPVSVNGRPGVPIGGMADEPTYDDFGGQFNGRGGFNNEMAMAPGQVKPTRPWETPDGTKPRWPGAPGSQPNQPKRNTPLIAATVVAAIVLLVVGCFLAYSLTNGLSFLAATPTATPIPNETVPGIVGKTCTDATTSLDAVKLKLNCTATASSQPKGTIISQDPPQGQIVKAGSVVQAQYSAGQQNVTIPQLANTNSTDACNTLIQQYALTCTTILQYSDSVGFELVIKTDPAAGTSVAPGTMVKVYVSEGPQPTATSAPTATATATATATPTCTPVTGGAPTPTPGPPC